MLCGTIEAHKRYIVDTARSQLATTTTAFRCIHIAAEPKASYPTRQGDPVLERIKITFTHK
jgi:hypothetical protein